MNCPFPLYRLPLSPRSLSALGYIRPGSSEFLGKRPHRGAYFFNSDQLSILPSEIRENVQPIGCGHCIACRLDYASEWSLRLRLEASLYPCNLFLTLTYDDEHLPESFFVDEDTGLFHLSDLQKRDVSHFMKRLRSVCHDRYGSFNGVRFFASGEYGDRTDRPHYHIILLNLPDAIRNELVFFSKNSRGDVLYSSPFFERLWRKGFVSVGECSAQSIGYVARYALKKVSNFSRVSDREVPFALMSRNPGIGAPYFYKNRSIIEQTGKVVVKDSEGSFCCSAPSYFFYLMKNAPIRAHRLPESLHYDSTVLAAQRKAAENVSRLKDQRAAALDHANDQFTEDLSGLSRPGLSTSRTRLCYLSSKSDLLAKKHKRYKAQFERL